MAQVLIYSGRSDEAENFIRKTLRLDPHYPAYPLWYLGLAQFCQGHFEDAGAALGIRKLRL
jgi:cytochrome c-type biogenesis protein CcmH/NrfG